jgi:hypothetical protein
MNSQQWSRQLQQRRIQQIRRRYDDLQDRQRGIHYLSTTRRNAGPCFIATAACGTAQTPAVARLRLLRDVVLLDFSLGLAFIVAYETVSPPIARCIAGSALARCLVRVMIVRPARWVADGVLRWKRII